MLGPLIVDQSFKGKGIGRELMNQSMSSINSNSINFIILIGELNYYGKFNFEVNTNIYFAINVRQEKILFKKLLDKNNTFFGKIELY
jgi:putative acetyltransferase